VTDTQRLHVSTRVTSGRTHTRRMCKRVLPAALIFIIMVEPLMAQVRTVASVSADPVLTPSRQEIGLLVGRSTVVTTDRPIQRVALSTPDVADALVTSSREVLIHGNSPGTISLLIWSDTGRITNYDVVVRRDLSDLQTHLTQLFPGEDVAVAANGTDVVLAGTVSSKYVVDNASAVAVGYVESADNVVNLLRQQEQEGVGSEQVMLRVRFAEVSRTAVQELGVSFFTDIFGSNGQVGRITTQQFAAPDFNGPNSQQFGPGSDGLVFSDFLNIMAFNNEESLGLVIRALETRGLFQSLAEPNLITQNGTEATFLAGGEYPYPILQGVSGAVTVLFKEFGIRLAFTPTITSQGRIQLKVAPEVSALDFSNSITIDGFRVPALSTRRTETQVELRDGQTFAVAGLLDNSVTETMAKIPGLGDIPILGKLFTSRAYQKSQSELVVMITPHIVRSGSAGVAAELPDLAQPFLTPSEGTQPPPPPVPIPDTGPAGVVPASSVAQGSLEPTQPAASQPVSAIAAAVPTIVPTPELQEENTVLAVEQHQTDAERKAEAKAARQEAKRGAEVAKHAAKVAQARLDVEQKQAEKTRKVEAKAAREEAKRATEMAKRAAKAEQARLAVERKQAEETRKVEAKAAREEAKRATEMAKRAAKAEQARLEVVRPQTEERRKAEAKAESQEAKRAAHEATRTAKAAQARLKVERKQAEETRKADEQAFREQQDLARIAQKRATEDAARVEKAALKLREAERKQAKRARQDEEKRDIAQAMAEAKRYQLEREQAKKLAEERAAEGQE
jgi:pilus assembly protein CpaC